MLTIHHLIIVNCQEPRVLPLSKRSVRNYGSNPSFKHTITNFMAIYMYLNNKLLLITLQPDRFAQLKPSAKLTVGLMSLLEIEYTILLLTLRNSE